MKKIPRLLMFAALFSLTPFFGASPSEAPKERSMTFSDHGSRDVKDQ